MKDVIKRKQEEVTLLSQEVKDSSSFVIFQYQGLTGSESQKVRREVFKSKGKLFVVKNTLLERALKDLNEPKLLDSLKGPNAIIFSGEDEMSPFKIVSKLAKEKKFVKIMCGYLEDKYVDSQKAIELASIPGRDGLYSMLLSMLQSPIRSVACAIKAVADSKQ
jgi:large subunit ribosomal protein L10